jgi:hypothetical protein
MRFFEGGDKFSPELETNRAPLFSLEGDLPVNSRRFALLR